MPVIDTVGYIDAENNYYKWSDNSPYKQTISECEKIQYNNIFDPENKKNEIFCGKYIYALAIQKEYRGRGIARELLETAEEGSTLICCEVSRLSRSTQQLCEIINIIKRKHMRLEIVGSITIDCRKGDIDPMSQAFIQMSAVFAELELSIIRARVKSGMANAKEKGKHVGRPQTTKDDIPAIFYKHYPAFAAKQMNVSELARICGLSRPTVYKYLKMMG